MLILSLILQKSRQNSGGVNMKNFKQVLVLKKALLQSLKSVSVSVVLAVSIAGMTFSAQATGNQIRMSVAQGANLTEVAGNPVQKMARRVAQASTALVAQVTHTAQVAGNSTQKMANFCTKNAKTVSVAMLTLTAGIMFHTYNTPISNVIAVFREIGNCKIYELSCALISGYFGCKIVGSCARDYARENPIKSAAVVAGVTGALSVSDTLLNASDSLSNVMFDILAKLVKRVNPQLLIALQNFGGGTVSDVTLPLWITYAGWKALKHVLHNNSSGIVVANENEGGALRLQTVDNESSQYALAWSLVALLSAIKA